MGAIVLEPHRVCQLSGTNWVIATLNHCRRVSPHQQQVGPEAADHEQRAAVADEPPEPRAYDPVSVYEDRTVEGCPLRIHRDLLKQPALAAATLREVRVQGFATREDGYWGRAVDYGGIPSAIAVAISSRGHIVGAVSLIWLAEQHSVASVAKAHLEKLTATAREIGELYAAHIG